jgi:cation transport ATPase
VDAGSREENASKHESRAEKKASPMSMVGFPLLLIPLAICNIIVFLMPGLSFSAPLITVPLMSGVGWAVTLSDVLLALGILMLLFEVIKGARPGAKYFTDHLLSLIVFGGAAAEFVMLPQFGTSTYFLLTALALTDFLSGLALRSRRSRAAVAAPSERAARTRQETRQEAPEPRFEPASSTPSTEPIVEPAPPAARTEPDVAHSDAVGREPSPEIQSPGLQPGSGVHPSPDNPPR